MTSAESLLRLVTILLDSYTPEGVVIWLYTHRKQLGVCEDDWDALIAEAISLTGMTAS